MVRLNYEGVHVNVVEAGALRLGALAHLLRRRLNCARIPNQSFSLCLLRRLHGLISSSDFNLLVTDCVIGWYLETARVC